MKKFSAIIFQFITIPTVFGQISDRTYNKAKIYLHNHQIVKVKKLTINNAEVSFLNASNNAYEKETLKNINLIKIPKGSYLFEGALYGAGTLALTALLIDIDPDPLLDKKRGAGFYLGYTAVGAALGGLIGSFFPKWKSLYTDGKFIGQHAPVNLDVYTTRDQINFKIVISL